MSLLSYIGRFVFPFLKKKMVTCKRDVVLCYLRGVLFPVFNEIYYKQKTSVEKPEKLDDKIKIDVKREVDVQPPTEFVGSDQEISHGPVMFGMLFILIFLGTFTLWGVTADIESATIAPGTIVVKSYHKKIQHLEGGIIKKIFVDEGDEVVEGQKLILLDAIAADSELEQIKKHLFSLKITRIRLLTEQEDKNTLQFPPEINEKIKNVTELKNIADNEKAIFLSRIQHYNNEISIIKQHVRQIEDEANGLKSQKMSAKTQINLLKEKKATKVKLFKKGYTTKDSVRNIEQNIVELEGDYGEYKANIARTKQRIIESKLKINRLRNERIEGINKELQEVDVKTVDLNEKMKAYKDISDRHVITSPQDGIVTNLIHYTIGGIITPGQTIMEIVPKNDKLIIEAKIHPNDVDVVHVNLPARVKISAFKGKKIPTFDGIVKYISPDKMLDSSTGAHYFLGKIEIEDSDMMEKYNVELYPGMSAEIFIVTGSRTFLEYVYSPLKETMQRSFREE